MLLSALFEGYIEEVYEQAVDILYAAHPVAKRNELKNHTSKKNHNANNHQVNNLMFFLGIPWAMSNPKVHWRKCANATVADKLGKLAKARNELAHGSTHAVTKPMLRAWREFIPRLAEKLDIVVADRIQAETGNRPW